MRVKDQPASKHFEDKTLGDWARSRQGGNLLENLLLQTNVHDGAPEGYANWVKDSMKDLTPNDLYMMKTHGLTIEDIARIKAVKAGTMPIDVSAYPYSNKFADDYIKKQKGY